MALNRIWKVSAKKVTLSLLYLLSIVYLTAIGLFLFTYGTIRVHTFPKVNPYMLNRIEALSTDITDDDYRELRSQYFKLASVSDYEKLDKSLDYLEQANE